jgi:hypothetical protein
MAVTVAMSMVFMSIPMPVPMFIVSTSMSMGSMAVAVRVTVLVVTVAVAWTFVPLAVLDAKPLDGTRDRSASFFGVDLAHARVVHVRGNRLTLVFAGGWLALVLHEALGIRLASELCAGGFVAT